MATVSPKCYLQQKNHVFRPELPKNSLKKASDIPSKLPDSNMTNPLPPFIKKRERRGKSTPFCAILFHFGRAISDYPGSEDLGQQEIQKNVYFSMFQAQKPYSVHFIMLRPYKESPSDDFCVQINELWVFLRIAQQ